MRTRRVVSAVLVIGLALTGAACSSARAPQPPAARPVATAAPEPPPAVVRYPVGIRLLKLRRAADRPLPTLLLYPASAPTSPDAEPPLSTLAERAGNAPESSRIEPASGRGAGQGNGMSRRGASGGGEWGGAGSRDGGSGGGASGGAGSRVGGSGSGGSDSDASGVVGSSGGSGRGGSDSGPSDDVGSGGDRSRGGASGSGGRAGWDGEAQRVSGRGVARIKEGKPGAEAVKAVLGSQVAGSGVGLPPRDGRFPLVLFSHGMSGSPQRLAAALAGWAAAGFVVAAPAYPYTKEHAPDYRREDIVNQPDDLRYVLRRMLKLAVTAGEPLRGRIDTDKIAAVGHSAGGYTTTGLFVAGHDPRLRAAVVMSGWRAPGAFAGPPAAMLFLQGTADPVVPMVKSRSAYARVPWPKRYVVLRGVSHANYLRPGDRGFGQMEPLVINFLKRSLITRSRGSAPGGPALPANP